MYHRKTTHLETDRFWTSAHDGKKTPQPDIHWKELTTYIDSVHDLVEYTTKQPPVKGGNPDHYSSRSTSVNFTHTKTFDEAVELIQYGWPDGKDDVKALVEKLSRAVSQAATFETDEVKTDIVGYVPHIGNYIAEVPDSMINFDVSYKPTLHIGYNVSASAGCSGASIKRRGAVTMALVQCLQAAGYNVELTVLDASRFHNGRRWYCIFPVKQASAPMNINKTCFMLCHPAYLRRFMFAVQERTKGSMFPSYGGACNVPEWIIKPDIMIPATIGGHANLDSEVEYLLDVIEKQGVKIVRRKPPLT